MNRASQGKTSPANPTIRDVAKAAGVAIGTVSRVLNGHKSASAQARQRVLEAVKKLSYAPDQIAQSMRRGSTRTVACMVRDISLPGFGVLVKAAEQALRTEGYSMVLAVTDNRPERELELLRTLLSQRVDGIMMTTTSEEDDGLCKMLAQLKVPLVLLDRDAPLSVDSVLIDHARGTCAAAEYLLSLGHARISLLTGQSRTRPARARIQGFLEAMPRMDRKTRGLRVREVGFSAEQAFRETSALLAEVPRPSALIAGGMETLTGVLQAIQGRNLKVPRDISVVAGADSELAQLAGPPITAVRWSGDDVGRTAVQMLLGRLQGGEAAPPQHVLLPTELVVRKSCAPPVT